MASFRDKDIELRVEDLGGSYTAYWHDDDSGIVRRFVGHPGQYIAAEFGPDKFFKDPYEAYFYFLDQDNQAAASERRCSQM